MLHLVRKNVKFVIWVVGFIVVAFVGTIFLVWGTGGPKSQSDNVIAMINDQQIYQSEFWEAYQNLRKYYQDIYKENFSDELVEKLKLKETALNELIKRKLLLMEAMQYGIKASDVELRTNIEQYQAFHKNGVFNTDLYVRVLKSVRLTPQDFENSLREDIMLRKIENIIKDGVKVSNREAREAYTLQNEKVDMNFILIEPKNYMGEIKITDEEISNYYNEHKANYKIPEKVKVKYIFIDPKSFAKEAKIDEEKIKDYYEDNIETYNVPKEVKASHILLKLDRNADEATETKIRERAEYVLQKIKEGAEFGALAEEFSQCTSGPKPHSGDLGYFQKGQMVPEFEEAAFALEKGETSVLVRTEFGYHIIKVEDIKEAYTKPLSIVRKEIESSLAGEEIKKLAFQKADDLLYRIENSTLNEAANEDSLSIIETEYFAMNEMVNGVDQPNELKKAAFSLTKGEVSDLIETPAGFYILELVDKKESYIPELEEVKTKVSESLINEKSDKKAEEKSNEIWSKLKDSAKFEDIAKSNKTKVEETGLFTKTGFVPNIGYSKDIAKAAFALKEGEFSTVLKEGEFSTVLKDKKGYYILKFKSKKGIDVSEFMQKREDIMQELLSKKQDRIYKEWIEDLKRKAKIKINDEMI